MEQKANQVGEYRPTEAALAGLRAKYQGILFDVTTTAGDKEARAARLELVTLRTSLEKKRKEIKAPALAYVELIDGEAKRIKAEIEALENPIDQQIRAEEDRKAKLKAERERIERERVAGILQMIDDIKRAPLQALRKPAAEIREIISATQALEITAATFAEFVDEAFMAREAAVTQLQETLAAKAAQEAEQLRIDAERAELASLREEAAARERLAAESRAEAEREAHAAREAEEARLAERRRQQDAELQAERDRLAQERAALEAARAEQESAPPSVQETPETMRVIAAAPPVATVPASDPVSILWMIHRLAADVDGHPDHATVRASIAQMAQYGVDRFGDMRHAA